MIGGTLIILDWSLESCLDLTQAKVTRYNYSRLEWKANSTLQLHRLAHEAVGSGTWTRATKDVPITNPGNILSGLDVEDQSHPRLVRSRDAAAKENAESSTGDGNTQSEVETEPDEIGSTHAESLNSYRSIHTHELSPHSDIDSLSDGGESLQDGYRRVCTDPEAGVTRWPEPPQMMTRASTH